MLLRAAARRAIAPRRSPTAWTRGRHSQRALPDLAILDIGLPRIDGLDLCRRLRARSETLPIIFVTSREEEFDRVLGLEIGADDYLCKPFSMRELMARVKVLLRRAALVPGIAGARPDERAVAIGELVARSAAIDRHVEGHAGAADGHRVPAAAWRSAAAPASSRPASS